MVYCTTFESRIGLIYIASTKDGVCKISVPRQSRREFLGWLREHFADNEVADNRSHNRDIIDQMERYFDGKLAAFTCPVDLRGTPFQVRVWKELAKIPYGTTISYKQLARRVGTSRGFQAVGRANAANPVPIVIPCHRVVGAHGALVGFTGGIKTKEFLLRLEGALIL